MHATHLRLVTTVFLLFCGIGMASFAEAQDQAAQSQLPASQTRTDNGIHVGKPKVYDSRELTLMLDNLSQQLQNKNFVDTTALAAALGNTQGFQSTDFSSALFANGAVGPQAASVFAAAAGTPAPTPPVTTATGNPITINVAPTLNAGSATTATSSTGAGTGTPTPLGPQAPALPALPTPPSYTPTFGENGSDLLSDEVNLTYQLYNVRMLLDRSLTDRLHGKEPRLEAVVGFDIDLEPDKAAKDAAAVVEVTAQMESATDLHCDAQGKLSLVALMPEEGSHNAATLSQKANAFGGAVAANVFSVGFAAQKRSQIFYLYRDMDTVSFQGLADDPTFIEFGWQFRPVLGRRSVDPGMRHLIVVLGLPCSDLGRGLSQISMTVRTGWERYNRQSQTTSRTSHFWLHSLPSGVTSSFDEVEVPSSEFSQYALQPKIDKVTWVPTDAIDGVAVVTGKNFFPGTTVRLGSRTYKSAADGLIIKSDHELEVAVPSVAVALGGVLSGRYGQAVPIVNTVSSANGFEIVDIFRAASGNSLYSIDLTLRTRPDEQGQHPTFASALDELNPPIVLLNGVPLVVRPPLTSDPNDPSKAHLLFPVAADSFPGATVFTVTFPFNGQRWSQSMSYYDTTLRVIRLSGPAQSDLVITATDAGTDLCNGWMLALDPLTTYSNGAGLSCLDPSSHTLALSIATDTLQKYKRFVLTHAGQAPLTGEIPKSDVPPPSPVVDKPVTVKQYDVIVTFTGKYLDKVTKALLEMRALDIVHQEAGKIIISLPKELTDKPRSLVILQLLSDGNDPIFANLTVSPNPETKGK